MNRIIKELVKSNNFKSLIDELKIESKKVRATGCNNSGKSYVTAGVFENTKGNIIYVTVNEYEAQKRYDDLKYLLGDKVYLYPSKDVFFYSSLARSKDVMCERMNVMEKLIDDSKKVIVLSADALLDKIAPIDAFKKSIITIDTSFVMEVDDLMRLLYKSGYEKVSEVTNPGECSVRGGILDICLANNKAYRIEFWGDEVDSIREFDIKTQRSKDAIEEVKILPMKDIIFEEENVDRAKEKLVRYRKEHPGETEMIDMLYETFETSEAVMHPEKYISLLFKEDELVNIIDYFDIDKDLIVLDEIKKIKQKCVIEEELFYEYLKEEMEKKKLTKLQKNIRDTYDDVEPKFKDRKILLYSMYDDEIDFDGYKRIFFNMQTIESFKKSVVKLKDEISNYITEDYNVVVLSATKVGRENLRKELEDSGYNAVTINDSEDAEFKTGSVYLQEGNLNSGFKFSDTNLVVLTEEDIYNSKTKRNSKKKPQGKAIESFADLNVGDFIVHDEHGIGIYEGVDNITVEGISKDYLKIRYADNSNLYVAIDQMNLVQKYIGNEDKLPKINKLGGLEWKKAKQKVKEAVAELAEKLVKLYAERNSVVGFEYSKDTDWQNDFEDEFPHVETNDQLLAIEDVKKDMESSKVMDRLICGDVGFGKTEVAIRAAFKAVQDQKQVVILAPTTILVEQHFSSFKERMKNYPIEVDFISRFRTPKQVNETIQKVKKGIVDIIIGTHRILSKDLEFKNLGLIIIDEEQRFGVIQKEKLKNINTCVDTLAMSATPIPRTLHMSLSGIRDISLLEEAPRERKPVQTYVLEKNNQLIKNGIYKEVGRGGQVFYLYNKVKGINKITNELRELMPDVRFEYAHGQMTKNELENIMHEFSLGNIDVLVSTTIIETGIDMPNVNTIIIEDADRMGLSQLYQLRGRVGRSKRTAYAYLMYQKDKVLSEDADKRLNSIKEFTELGSGFKIAMRDLEIRGAGNLLGPEQHGHMASVGYDMYCKILEEAVRELKGEIIRVNSDTKIELKVDAYMPPEYISDNYQKIEMYKKIAAIENKDELIEVTDELIDRFGDTPSSVQNLVNISLIKSYAGKLHVQSITQNQNKIVMIFNKDAEIDDDTYGRIMEFVNNSKGNVRIETGLEPKIVYNLGFNKVQDYKIIDSIEKMLTFIVGEEK